ncbi:alpha/beta hydrolase family protein [Mesonia maritima]|uniref:Pimeloyl-ACP methyl ester carboxylesterase n=1 Tax=Mesonia maritima TaxID=1793873 RepID=A0ABU1K2M4_9FLAO|nr:alpha/beta fold hydrolase [Mesonia maritima]MDR6299861.1 pimeloyl-ACP methyl ester carboxylesterase [Mesonia maritima]
MIKEKNFTLKGKHNKPIVTDVYYQPTHKPKPIVIFCHGYKGFKDWGAWNLVAERFAQEDFFFIKFNFSHNGGTPEEPIDFPDLEAFGNDNYTKQLDDLQTVIDWIITTKEFSSDADVRKLNLIGHSRGGGIVLLKAAENKTVKKVVTWAGVSDFASRFPEGEALEKWKKDKVYYIENGRTKQKMPHYIQFYENFQANKERLSIQNAVKKLEIPQLIIHAKGDSSVSISEADKLHQWNPRSKTYFLEKSNHVFNTKHPWNSSQLSQDLTEVCKETKAFLKA